MEKTKNAVTLFIFAVVIFGFCAAFFILPDNSRSQTERRLLAQPPEFNAETIMGGEYMKKFEAYLQDQFPLREAFRTVNAVTRRYAFGQRDHRGYYYAGGYLSQMDFPLDAKTVGENAAWFNTVANNICKDMHVYYAIFPDKNYFLAEKYGYLAFDYSAMLDIVHEEMGKYTYIDLFDVMSLDGFYSTDIHWQQESIYPVAERLAREMGVTLPSRDDFTVQTLAPFKGSFLGHSALPVKPDELTYLTNQYTENAVVQALVEENRAFVFSQYIEADGARVRLGVYNPALFGGMDSYDVFLAGAQAIVTIEIPDASTDRELIIFRDSYGSSIAPLLLGGYTKITLVDIRYIQSRLLPNFIEFENQDILFLYNSMLLNRSGLLR